MALLRIEGFDHQNSPSVDLLSGNGGAFQWRTQSNIAFTGGRFGGKAAQFGNFLQGTLTNTNTSWVWGQAMYMAASSAIQIWVYDSTTQNPQGVFASDAQATIVLDGNNGSISAYRGSTQGGHGALLSASGNNQFPVNAWFYLEFGGTISATIGTLAVKVNGNIILNLSGLNTKQSVNAFYDSIGMGTFSNVGVNPTGILVDDLYLSDESGPAPFNTFLGPQRVCTLFPDANAGVQYTPLAGTNWQEVSETAMDNDTSYNSDATVGHQDLFTVDDLPLSVVPTAVQITGAYKQDSAGTRAMKSALKSGATTAYGASLFLQTSYAYQCDVWTEDPDTSAAWTVLGVNSMEIGYNTTN